MLLNKLYRGGKNKKSIINAGQSIHTGYNHTVALTETGKLYGWGGNEKRQSSPTSATTPLLNVTSPFLTEVAKAETGQYHTLILMKDGTVRAIGGNAYKETDPFSSTQPSYDLTKIVTSGVIDISAGRFYSICLYENGDVCGWGFNKIGLAYPYIPSANYGTVNSYITETDKVIIGNIKKIYAGSDHVMVIDDDDNLYGWGYNSHGQINGITSSTYKKTPDGIIKGNIKKVAVGAYHSVILDYEGNVYCIGKNDYGQCDAIEANIGVSQTNLNNIIFTNAIDVAAGHYHTAVLDANGDVHAWGCNTERQCNTASSSTYFLDKENVVFSGATAIFSGSTADSTFALKSNGYIYGWGDNTYGKVTGKTNTSYYIDTTTPIMLLNK